ncbi:MAG: SDR family NAD(P)-dependent oxidoreductase [Sphingorhabdus sp.]
MKMQPNGRIVGRSAIVTGGARGIGAAICEQFCAEDGLVFIADNAKAAGEELAARLSSQGGSAQFLHLDVTDEDSWCAAIAKVSLENGRIDILVNNAGIALGTLPIVERDVQDWDRVMSVNARSVFLGVKHVVPVMIQGGGGAIVNMSSAAALGQWQNMEAAYAASKAAVHVFTKATGTQYAEQGVRCNTVHPGPIETEMMREVLGENPEVLAHRLVRVPMGRLGKPDEVAAAVLFLASDEASYITAAQLSVDGGAVAQ